MDNEKSGYGLCVENPVRLTSIPLEYLYLAHLVSPAGTPFVPSGNRSTYTGLIDCHHGHYLNADGERVEANIFLHGYNRENDIRPPDGWSLTPMELPKNMRKSSRAKQGCLVPFVLTIGSLAAASFAICYIIF